MVNVKKADIVKNLEIAMRHSAEVQKTISRNISLANNPQAKAKKVEELDFKKMVNKAKQNSINLSKTNENHIAGATRSIEFAVKDDRDADEITPVGNNIVLEQQLKNASDNNLNYTEYTKIYTKYNSMLKMILAGKV